MHQYPNLPTSDGLVLSLLPGESIIIGDNLLITVVAIRGPRASISISHRAFGGRLNTFNESVRTWLEAQDVLPLAPDFSCKLVDVRGDKVRLGIHAPKDISVHRKEVYDAIRRQRDEGDTDHDEPSGSPVPR